MSHSLPLFSLLFSRVTVLVTWWEGGVHVERKEVESTQHFCDRTVLDNRIRIVRNAVSEVSQQVLSSLVLSL